MGNPGKTSFRGKFHFKIERKMLMREEKEGHIKIKVLYPKTDLLPKTAFARLVYTLSTDNFKKYFSSILCNILKVMSAPSSLPDFLSSLYCRKQLSLGSLPSL